MQSRRSTAQVGDAGRTMEVRRKPPPQVNAFAPEGHIKQIGSLRHWTRNEAVASRILQRKSGTWELLGSDERCAFIDGVEYYWCALRRGGGWRWYSRVVRLPPQRAPEHELIPQLEEVVRTCRALW